MDCVLTKQGKFTSQRNRNLAWYFIFSELVTKLKSPPTVGFRLVLAQSATSGMIKAVIEPFRKMYSWITVVISTLQDTIVG